MFLNYYINIIITIVINYRYRKTHILVRKMNSTELIQNTLIVPIYYLHE